MPGSQGGEERELVYMLVTKAERDARRSHVQEPSRNRFPPLFPKPSAFNRPRRSFTLLLPRKERSLFSHGDLPRRTPP